MSCFLSYSIVGITGDCTNSNLGSFEIDIYGSAPDYTIQWLSPALGTIPLGAGVTAYTETNLSAGTYSFNIVDSCIPNTLYPVNIYISSGTCANIDGVSNTTCSFNNGSLTASTTNLYDTAEFYLLETTYGYIDSGATLGNTFVFDNLSAGTYYVIANDGGGCLGYSQSCIIKSSTTLDFGFYVINDAGCATSSGAIYITGLTGTPPYTYLWSNGATTQNITGLTNGSYSVSVTDSSGCVQGLGTEVTLVPNVGLGLFTVTNPSCFGNDGEVTVILTGGTAPYYYSGSNGSVAVSFSTSHTFTGLGQGFFSVLVTDAGLCSFEASTSLLTPNAFIVVSVSTTNSTCNNLDGLIGPIVLFGGTGPFTYSLSGTNGTTLTQTTPLSSWSFAGLSSGDYLLTISDGGPCTYSGIYTINNISLFDLSVYTTGTTCNLNNGSVTLEITTGGTAPFNYQIDGSSVYSSFSSFTFTNLSSGSYTATVTDANLCSQILPFVIDSSSMVDFSLSSTDSTNGSNGTISTYITSGEPPFILNWSSNVNGQTGLTVTNLSAGTYSLEVIDVSGCTQTRYVNVNGVNNFTSYRTYPVCESTFNGNPTPVKKGPKQMLFEGFTDLTVDSVGCVLNQAIFIVEVIVNGVTKQAPIYTATTLNEYPGDNIFYNKVEELLLSFNGIGTVTIDELANEITILTDCTNTTVDLRNASVVVKMKIDYDISCVICGPVCKTYEIYNTYPGLNNVSVTFTPCCDEIYTSPLVLDKGYNYICSYTVPEVNVANNVTITEIGDCGPCSTYKVDAKGSSVDVYFVPCSGETKTSPFTLIDEIGYLCSCVAPIAITSENLGNCFEIPCFWSGFSMVVNSTPTSDVTTFFQNTGTDFNGQPVFGSPLFGNIYSGTTGWTLDLSAQFGIKFEDFTSGDTLIVNQFQIGLTTGYTECSDIGKGLCVSYCDSGNTFNCTAFTSMYHFFVTGDSVYNSTLALDGYQISYTGTSWILQDSLGFVKGELTGLTSSDKPIGIWDSFDIPGYVYQTFINFCAESIKCDCLTFYANTGDDTIAYQDCDLLLNFENIISGTTENVFPIFGLDADLDGFYSLNYNSLSGNTTNFPCIT